jgi:hypothetical protein
MSAHRLLAGLAAWCALASLAGAATGQTAVFPVQDLAFGQLQPGVSTTVAATDASRRAELDLSASGTLVLTMVLPTNLVSAVGSLLPVSFSSGSAHVRWNWLGLEYAFNPNAPYTLWLPRLANGGSIYLGGTASPRVNQQPGVYTATITLIVANAGT